MQKSEGNSNSKGNAMQDSKENADQTRKENNVAPAEAEAETTDTNPAEASTLSPNPMSKKRIAVIVMAGILAFYALITFFSTSADVTMCHNAFVAATAQGACNKDTAVHYIALFVFTAGVAGGLYAWFRKDKA